MTRFSIERTLARIQYHPVARLIKNSGLLLTANLISRVTSIVLIGMMARQWGQIGVASYVLAVSWGGYTIFLADLGLSVLAVRTFSILLKPERPSALGNIITLKLMVLPLFLIAAIAAWVFLPYDASVRSSIILVGVGIAITTFSQTFFGMFRASEQMELEAVLTVAFSAIWVMVGVLIIQGGGTIVHLSIAFLLVNLVQLLLIYLIMVRAFGSLSLRMPRSPRDDLNEAVPFGVTSVVARGYTEADIQMLSFFVTAAVLGAYSAGARLVVLASLLPVYISQAVFPIGSRLWSQQRHEDFRFLFQSLLKYQFSVSLLIAASVAVLADHLVRFIYGPGFDSSVPILQLLAVVIPLKFISQALGNALETSGQQRTRSVIAVAGLVIAIILNLLLISKFGIVGAIVAVIFGELFMVALMFFVTRRKLAWSRRYWFSMAILLLVGLFVFALGELLASAISSWNKYLYVATIIAAMTASAGILFWGTKQLPGIRELRMARGSERNIVGS